jgi:hypothetical protein
MAIVYQHRRKDTQEIFYIGIGLSEDRAYAYGRNHLWQEVVDETEYYIEITHKDIIYEEACSIEKYLIAFWGRKDLGLGPLTNLTDGGDTSIGYIHSNETKEKLKQTWNILRNKRIPWNKGLTKDIDNRVKKYSEVKRWNTGLKKGDSEILDRIHLLKMKKIKDLKTNIEYISMTEACNKLNLSRHRIYKFLKEGTFKYI